MGIETQGHDTNELREPLELSEETFFLFGKYDSECILDKPAKLLPSILLDNVRQYVSHSTQTMIIDDQLHYLTLYKLKLPSVRADAGLNYHILWTAKRGEGVKGFGQGPAFTRNSCRIVCQNCSSNERRFYKNDLSHILFSPRITGCYLKTKSRGTHIKNVMVELPPRGYSPFWEQTPIPNLEFTANRTFHPMTFRQSYPVALNNREVEILNPGSCFSEFYKLNLRITKGTFLDLNSPLRICGLEVQVHEVIKCLEVDLKKGPRVLWDASYLQLQNKPVSVKLSLELLKDEEFLSFDLPDSILNCRVPDLGPTFLSRTFKRSYYLKLILRVRHKLTLMELVLVSPVQVAKNLSLIHIQSSPYHHMIFLEKLSEPWSSIKNVGEAPLQRFRNSKFRYVRHQTDSFIVQDTLLAITKVEFAFQNSTDSVLDYLPRLFLPAELAPEEPSNLMAQDKNFKITCRVTKMPEISKLCFCTSIAKLCIQTEGIEIPIKLSIHGFSYSEDYRWQITYPAFLGTYQYKKIHPEYIRLSIWSVRHQSDGALVLSPNHNLDEIVGFRIHVSDFRIYSLLDRMECPITIKKVTIKIKKVSSWLNMEGKLCASEKARTIFVQRCNQKIGGILDIFASRDEYNHEYWMDLPNELYSVRIPPIKPTVFAHTFSRVHWLIVAFELYLDTEKEHVQWMAKVPVLVAEE